MQKFLLLKFTSLFYYLLLKIKFFWSFSQEGEDLIINRILKTKKIKYDEIFYLDIGSGHPIKYSNTFYFYIRGSKGIAVDAFEKNIKLHRLLRPRDKSFDLILGNDEKLIDYYVFNQSELNTISKKRVNELEDYKISPLYTQKKQQSMTYNFFLKKVGEDIKRINLFSIDIEGAELEVLKSINWENFKPEIICVEIIIKNFDDLYENEVFKILKLNGYTFYSKLINSVIFIKN